MSSSMRLGEEMNNEEDLAQVISDSFFGMMAGDNPTKEEQQKPNAGDMQLAVDIIASDWYARVKADEIRQLQEQIAYLQAAISEARDLCRVSGEVPRRVALIDQALAKGLM